MITITVSIVRPGTCYGVECGPGCDRPDTHQPVWLATLAVAHQIAAVRRRQHGHPYGETPAVTS